jgi:nitrogen regulatory protein P-II 1
MKLITAVVQPHKLHDLSLVVSKAGARGLTATEVVGFGQQFGHMGTAPSAESDAVLVLHKLRIDVLVPDELAEPVTSAIAEAVRTGTIGDGKIWVCPVGSVLRVRTGERDSDAV